MEQNTASQQVKKQKRNHEDTQMNQTDNNEENMQTENRKKLTAKRVLNEENQKQKFIGENGEEISFEDDEDDIDENDVIHIDEQEVIQVESSDENWEDQEDEGEQVEEKEVNSKKKQKDKQKTQTAPEIWNDTKEPLKDDQELDFESSAYEMLHRSSVEWPCLSIDVILRDRCQNGDYQSFKQWFPQKVCNQLDESNSQINSKLDIRIHKNDKYPMSAYFCAGSQSFNKNENKIYVMKWSDMVMTVNDDKIPEENSDDDEQDLIDKMNFTPKEPIIRFESIPHRGCVNRIRSLHGSNIVATWSDEGEVGIYNIQPAIDDLDAPVDESILQMTSSQGAKKKKKNLPKKNYGGTKIAQFRHKQEGYAIEWSPLTYGRLASGSCDAHLMIYRPADENCSAFIKETQVALQGHKDSIEDIQWSPSQENVLATCSVDKYIKLWDLRATQMKCQVSFQAHDCDINTMSWNTNTKFLLASGDDRGEFKIWDLRMLGEGAQGNKKQLDSITKIRWHTSAITSLQFEPREASVLAVASEDNKMTLWDFSVEMDEQEIEAQKQQMNTNGMDIPPQLLFLHQGQKNMKELRFHPQYRCLIFSTAEDSFNIFRPNLDPDLQEDNNIVQNYSSDDSCDEQMEEEKNTTDNTSNAKVPINGKQQLGMGMQYSVDSDEDEEDQEKRIKATNKQIRKNRLSRSKSRAKQNKNKRVKKE